MRQFINEKAIFETWSPIIQKTTNISEKERLTWMSLVAQNQRLHEDVQNRAHVNPNMDILGMGAIKFPGDPSYTYNFANQTPGSGDRPYSLLPLAMQVAAQTIGLDLVPVVPMPGPLGMLTYLDYVYSGGKLNSLEGPFVIKIKLSLASGITLTLGTTYFVRNNTTNYYRLTYIGKSRIDGYPIFRVIPANTDGTAMAIGAVANLTIADAIAASSLYSAASGATEIADFAGTAELVKALEDHIPGFSGRSMRLGDGVTNGEEPYLREEGEQEPESMMGLTLRTQSVEAQTYQVGAAVTREQVDDLRQYGIDAMAQLEAILSNEMTQTINKLILGKMFKDGATSHTRWFENSGENYNLNFDLTNDKVIYLGTGMDGNAVPGMLTPKYQALLDETHGDVQRRILTMILGAANAINNHTRRGSGNFCVTNFQVATVLQSLAGYHPFPMNNNINQNSGSLYNMGQLAGINIYVDPNMPFNDTRVLIGRKGDANSTGIVFMPYLMSQSVSIIAESTMAPKVAVKSRFAVVDAGHYPEDNYITLRLQTGNVLPTILA